MDIRGSTPMTKGGQENQLQWQRRANDPRDLFGLRGYHAVDPGVIEKMVQFLGPDGVFGNPSSTLHRQGLEANNAVEQSRQL